MKGKLWLVVLAAGLMVVLQACGIIGGGSNPGGQVSISISPTSASLQPSGTKQFTATVTGTSNTAVSWSVTGGIVSGSGDTVTYTAPTIPGSYTLIAISQADPSKQGRAAITVNPPSQARIEITSDKSAVLTGTGSTAEFTAVVYRSDGTVDKSAKVTWTSSDPSVVSIDADGKATAKAALGSANITASYGQLEPQVANAIIGQLNSGTVLLNSSDVVAASLTQLILKKNATTSAIKVGQVLVSGSKAGVLAKVKAVHTSGKQIIVDISPASLTDAFSQLSVNVQSQPLHLQVVMVPAGGISVSSVSNGQIQPLKFIDHLGCKGDAGISTKVSVTGPSIHWTPSFHVLSHVTVVNRTVETFEMIVFANADFTATTGSFEVSGSASGKFNCSVTISDLNLPVAAIGPITISAYTSPTIGVRGNAEVQSTFTVTGPSATVSLQAKGGIIYNDGQWHLKHSVSATKDVDPLKISSAFDTSFSADFGPYFSTESGINVTLLGASLVKFGFFDTDLYAGLHVGLDSPVALTAAGYSGPSWGVALESEGALEADLRGSIFARFLRLVGVGASLESSKLQLWDKTWSLLNSPDPTVTSSETKVTSGAVTLSASAPKGCPPSGCQGDKVEFWGVEDGGSKALKLASGTLNVDGKGTATWTPTASDNGSYSIVAYLYDNIFGAVGLPYASSQPVDLTVDVSSASPKSNLVISSVSVSPTSGPAGSEVNVNFTIQNEGPGDAGASTTHIDISPSPTDPTVSYIVLKSISTRAISAGGTDPISENVTIPSTLAADTYYIWAVADAGDKLNQSSKNDDRAETAFTVSSSTPSPTSYTLSVMHSGSGSGTVTSDPPGIDCGSDCNAQLDAGSTVTLVANPNSGSTFAGWGGACSSASTSCTITMNDDKSVTANFAKNAVTYTLNLSGNHGQVKVNGAAQSLPYHHDFAAGSGVSLEAVPDDGYKFSDWSGDLNGSASPTSITMNGDKDITVNFSQEAAPGTLSVTPSSGLAASGTQGGPFNPSSQSYTLTNTGGSSIDWTASNEQNWVSLSRTSGTLGPGDNVTVTVGINDSAKDLGANDYSDTVSFTNTTNGQGNTTRPVYLRVAAPTNHDPAISSFSANPSSGDAPLSVTFNWSVSDPDGDALTCLLNYGDGSDSGTIDNCESDTSRTHKYTTKGSYQAILAVSDGKGGQKQDVRTIHVDQPASQPPVVNSFEPTPRSGSAPLPVTFNWSVSDPDSSKLGCIIDFGDNSNHVIFSDCESTTSTTHTYANSGTYRATFVVSDPEDNTANRNATITVENAPSQPRELIQNGSFSDGSSGWNVQLDVWVGTNLSNYRTPPGYAALGVYSDGTPKANATGVLSSQAVTIPANATEATASFWYNISSYGSQRGAMLASVGNGSSCDVTIADLSNQNATNGQYREASVDVTQCRGQTVAFVFSMSSGASPVVFRVDDVRLMSDGN